MNQHESRRLAHARLFVAAIESEAALSPFLPREYRAERRKGLRIAAAAELEAAARRTDPEVRA